MDFFDSPEQIQSVLAGYDKEEQEMSRVLTSLSMSGPEAAYRDYARACVRMRKQIAIRRRLFKSMLGDKLAQQ